MRHKSMLKFSPWLKDSPQNNPRSERHPAVPHQSRDQASARRRVSNQRRNFRVPETGHDGRQAAGPHQHSQHHPW